MNRSNNLRTTIESYGDYSNSNYGTHTMRVTLENGDLLYYSYRTYPSFWGSCRVLILFLDIILLSSF